MTVKTDEPLVQPAAEPEGDGPWRITFDTNPDDCNLSCIMCEDHSPYSKTQETRRRLGLPKRRMDIALIRWVLADSAGTRLREIIPSTMGEPLLYRHFEEILELCAQHGVLLNLTTNGTFPRKGARAWAELLVPVTSDMKISWNGATRETQEAIMLGADWESVLQNVRTLVEVRDAHAAAGGNRCRVTFQLTFMQANFKELPEIVRLAAELGVDRVKGHHLWVHVARMQRQSMRRSATAVREWNDIVEKAHSATDSHRLPNGKKVLLENIYELGEQANEIVPGGVCPFLGQEAWVASDGRFNPCCAPDALRRTLGDFGNLHESGLLDIWQGDAYRSLKANYMQNSLCRGCNMRKPVIV